MITKTAYRIRISSQFCRIDLIDDIIESGGISGTHLRMLVEQIVISENERGLRIEIDIKAPFRTHFDVYDDNELLGRNFIGVIGY